MRVNIVGGGRQVEIECADTNTTPADIVALARKTWESTHGATHPSDGPAYGFQYGNGAAPPRVADFGNKPLTVTS